MSFCPYCGGNLDDVSLFCGKCGKKQPNKSGVPTIENAPDKTAQVKTLNDITKPPLLPVKNKKGGKFFIITIAFLCLCISLVSVWYFFGGGESSISAFLSKSDTSKETTEAVENSTEKSTAVYHASTNETTLPHASTTVPTKIFSITEVQQTFSSFYKSYLLAINSLNKEHISFCSENVSEKMSSRFEINKKRKFTLQKIGYDTDSIIYSKSGSISIATFYVKCITKMYDRSNNAYLNDNEAIWLITVSMDENGYCYVSAVERNDKFKLSQNIEWVAE